MVLFIYFTDVYGHVSAFAHHALLSSLLRFFAGSLPWLVFGDFNSLMGAHEHIGNLPN